MGETAKSFLGGGPRYTFGLGSGFGFSILLTLLFLLKEMESCRQGNNNGTQAIVQNEDRLFYPMISQLKFCSDAFETRLRQRLSYYKLCKLWNKLSKKNFFSA